MNEDLIFGIHTILTSLFLGWAVWNVFEISELKSKAQNLQKRNEALEKDRDKYFGSLMKLEKERNQYRQDIQDLNQRNKELEFAINEYKLEIEAQKEEKEIKEGSRNYWMERYQSARNEAQTFRLINENRLIELSEKERHIQVLNGRIGGLTKQNNRLKKNG